MSAVKAFQSCELSELDIFSAQPIQTSIVGTDCVFYNPVTSLDNANVIEFFIPASSDHYRDLNSTTLHLRVQLLKSNGSVYLEKTEGTTKKDEAKNQPAFINNALHSIFKSCAVYMNNKLVSFTDGLSYKDYFDKILCYDESCTKTSLVNEGFVKDTSGTAFGVIDDKNIGLKERRSFVTNSTMYDLVGKVNVNIFNIQKLMINGVDIRIVFTLENPKFFLMESKDTNSTMKIHEAMLRINQFNINPDVLLQHRQLLHKGIVARYPFKKTEIKMFTLPSGVSTVNLDNVFNGPIPTNIVCGGVVANMAFTGNSERNPLYFHNYNISSVGLYVNSKCVTGYPIEMAFVAGVYARAYAQFLEGSGNLNTDRTNSITKTEFKRGYCMFPFILSSTQFLDSRAEVPKEGTLRLELKFSAATTETLTVICYAEFDAQLQIDKNLNVSVLM